MKVLLVEPLKAPRVIDLDGSLTGMQKTVGGYIQAVYPFSDMVAIICNDEGKINRLPLNRALRTEDTNELYDIICGTFLICGIQGDGFTDLTDNQIAKYTEVYRTPETFINLDGQIICLPCTDAEEQEGS